jgi:ADP-dependent NAD(P)H-hydrate dehydratase / NAD(P)H-hydrate epimerase
MVNQGRKGFSRFLEKGIISPRRMKVVEMNAMALGLPAGVMMESAGRALAGIALSKSPERVTILCGKGNNGGDGMVAARYLGSSVEVYVWYLDQHPLSPATEKQCRLLRHCDITMIPFCSTDDLGPLKETLSKSDLVIDALLGTGAGGNLREPLATCVRVANKSDVPILSADVPTPGIKARWICAFHRAKTDGAEVVDIGIPIEAEVFTGPGDVQLVPKRDPASHKGMGGRVLVIGGGPYQGAPYLAGLGALRAGADIVRIASPVFEPVPDLIYERLAGDIINKEHIQHLIDLIAASDVVLCGNGLGAKSHDVVQAIAPHCKKAIFDADALRKPLPEAGETIYTPHAGEFARISGITPPTDLVQRALAVRSFAAGKTILLKGPVDIISDGSLVRFNRTGTPSMTVGGTGDVLAGVAAALFCHLPAFDSAVIAAYVNGMSGMTAEKVLGGGLLASDLVNYIPGILSGKGEING